MHEGHRQRMYDKLKNGDTLFEHELLEILLYNAYPRLNTNPIAHDLLNKFGTISGVLDAEIKDLVNVRGVGERVALYLKCIGECVNKSIKKPSMVAQLKNYQDFREFIKLRMRGKEVEVLELYCLERTGVLKKILSYTEGDINKVTVQTEKLAEEIATAKPYAILVAHNHPAGTSKPSEADDNFTKNLQLICSINSVRLLDHCIYASDSDIYSYFYTGQIEEIKQNYSYFNLISEQLKKDKDEK